MSANKSDKELAFLQELYVATDWGERFAALMDQHVELPKKGRALYVAAGTGGHALALQERAGDDVTFVCIDESEECLELARVKAMAIKADPEFRRAQLEDLGFEDDQFDLVLGDASLVASERLPEIIPEIVRVAAPGGSVALSLATSSSFSEFYSIYWEALRSAGLEQYGSEVEALIRERPTVVAVEEMA
ncbi:MAG: class I SAM-dependent methyltransferase, partial [Acidobacteria bacterium]|nr:class I SAM-dependent methyltransferase [Acidobacteriota bacterium]